MEAGKKTISDIFNGNRILEIPFFQRAYVWEDEQWGRLLEDMEEISQQNTPYFLGSVILKQQMTSTTKSVSDVRTLIDGQQRLTTLSIFLKTLCLKNNENNKFERVFKLIDDSIALEHNHNDINNYNEILNLETEKDIDKTNNISRAYTYFKNNIKAEKLNFQKILSNVMFVGIDLGIDEDEQQIFDTINSLGVRLTTAELLKNHFFGRDDLNSYDANWKQIFEKDDETKEFWDREVTAGRTKRENIDLFFYSFLQIKLQDKNINVKTDDKKRLSKFSNLFESYKEFMKIYNVDKVSLIQEIKEYAILYKDNINFNIIDTELTDVYGIERINALIFGLEYTVIIPFVLYVLNNTKDNKEEQKNIFMYLESYLMRRMISKSTNKSYSNLFSEELISNEITSKEKFQNLINEKTDKNNSMPSDEVVKQGFLNSKIVNKQTRGIIYLIESIIRIKDKSKHSTGLLGLDRYSLEHMMPKKWENHWDKYKSFTDEERQNRNNKLLTLGNLAIITSSLNSSIRDSNWDKKKNGTDKHSGLIKFTSGIETINEYLQYETWDENKIDERAEFLYEKAMEIWAL
ncbi:MAG: DUF262 domain-containing HNH endonuclease family protein [Campylobacterota bacterium]|nr:DUF262 domain-containing HNH endonuclease family protein [Campylobacterota bacterium]